MRVGVVMHAQADLLQIVRALRAPGRFAGRLHGRQQQRHQHADDGDHHQQLDERKTVLLGEHHGKSSAEASLQTDHSTLLTLTNSLLLRDNLEIEFERTFFLHFHRVLTLAVPGGWHFGFRRRRQGIARHMPRRQRRRRNEIGDRHAILAQRSTPSCAGIE